MDNINIDKKLNLLKLAREKLQLQLQDIKDQLSDLQSSGAEELKSSAGDKYETQREMIKQSRDILDVQLSRVQSMMHHLERISCNSHDHVQEGSLVKLSVGQVLISISLGKLVQDEQEYQLISKESPLFLAIKGLKAKQSAAFRGKIIFIEEVI